MSAEGTGNFGFGFVPTNFGLSTSSTPSGFFDPSTSAASSPFSAQGPGFGGSGSFSSFGNNTGDAEDYENEPPLLEELGISSHAYFFKHSFPLGYYFNGILNLIKTAESFFVNLRTSLVSHATHRNQFFAY
jgi:hypothetical protein